MKKQQELVTAKWSEIDSLINNRMFRGHAKKMLIPPASNSGAHQSNPSPGQSYAQQTHYADPPLSKRPALMPPPHANQPTQGMILYAILYNRGSCPYGHVCKFRHMRPACSGRHPRASCRANRLPMQSQKERGAEKPPVMKTLAIASNDNITYGYHSITLHNNAMTYLIDICLHTFKGKVPWKNHILFPGDHTLR